MAASVPAVFAATAPAPAVALRQFQGHLRELFADGPSVHQRTPKFYVERLFEQGIRAAEVALLGAQVAQILMCSYTF